MKVNSKKIKEFPKKYRKSILQPLNDKSNILIVNNNGIHKGSTKELTKCNSHPVQSTFWFNIFSLPLNTCNNNTISKRSVLIGLYQVFMLQLTLANGNPKGDTNGAQQPNAEIRPCVDVSFLEKPKDFLTKYLECVFDKRDKKSIQYGFVFLAVIAAVLSAIGAIYKRICKCCCGSTETPTETENDEEVDYRAQFEHLQQEQEQLRKDLMERQQLCKDDMKDEENNNSSKRTDESENSNSRSDNICIGYQKGQD
ncbi:hypothetical protein, conserved [Plasmodium ovale]|uniref:Uncharacterized protein n=1 Tax=Plasmodium ovale TaxID=36330 RepID=A0A1C3KGC0_PLAOA|nr:hypothetical protein, conserved [Plasmodium ovale]